MHLTLEDLLEARDSRASDDATEHLAGCPECAAELVRLAVVRTDMAALPAESPGTDHFQGVVERLETERWRRTWSRVGWAAAGFAIVVTLATGVRGGVEAWQEARIARATHALVAQSEELESELRSFKSGNVLSGRTARNVMEIEDRIAVIDAQLAQLKRSGSSSSDAVDLWQQRVMLLDTLVDMHTTRQAYVGL
jgi:hypothetical protein